MLSRMLSGIALLTLLFTTSHCTSVRALPDTYAPAPDVDLAYGTNQDRHISYSADLRLAAREPEETIAESEAIAKRSGGYLGYRDNTSLQVFVPADSLESVLDRMATLANVRHRSIRAADFTEAYTDVDIRLSNAKKSRDRYLELLERAESVADILAVERELERLNVELESLGTQQRRMQESERFSSIDLRVTERPRVGPVGWLFYGVWKAVEWIF